MTRGCYCCHLGVFQSGTRTLCSLCIFKRLFGIVKLCVAVSCGGVSLSRCLAVEDSGLLCRFPDGQFVCFPLSGHKRAVSLSSAPPPPPPVLTSSLPGSSGLSGVGCALSLRELPSDCRKVGGPQTGGSLSATEGTVSGVPAPRVFSLSLCCFHWWLVSPSLCAATGVRFLEFQASMSSDRKALLRRS